MKDNNVYILIFLLNELNIENINNNNEFENNKVENIENDIYNNENMKDLMDSKIKLNEPIEIAHDFLNNNDDSVSSDYDNIQSLKINMKLM